MVSADDRCPESAVHRDRIFSHHVRVINLALSAPGSYEIDVEHHVSMFCILYGLAYILFVVFTEPVFTALVGWSAGAAIHMIVFWVGLLGGLYALSVHQ